MASAWKGRVRASIVQSCVVTLEPVPSKIDEPSSRYSGPGMYPACGRRPANDTGEMMLTRWSLTCRKASGDTIDAGEVATEFAAMAIDPYPRKGEALPSMVT